MSVDTHELDSIKPGDTVEIIKNTWPRPGTIGKTGVVVEDKSIGVPFVRVQLGKYSHTFAPGDVRKVER